MIEERMREALTFDDILLVPGYSDFLPKDADTRTKLTRDLHLQIPLISAAMDTVTESRTAVTMAREGGLGIVHENLSPALASIGNMPVHLGSGWLVVERTHVGGFVKRVTEFHQLGCLEAGGNELLVYFVDNDHSLRRTAHLTGVVVGPVDRRFCGCRYVGIGSHDRGTVAGHLHDRSLDTHQRDDLAAGL